MRSMRTWTVLGALLVFTLWLGSCATNPATGKSQISLVSQSQEIQIGAEEDRNVQASLGYYDDAALTAYVDQVGQKLARVTELPSLTWHFHVVDSPEVNAFALPGGYIYVTRGILAVVNNEAQLAGVMGHEEGHVTARHSAQQITRAQLANIGIGVGSIVSSDFKRVAGVATTGLQLLFLKYSRGDETQADELGVRYTSRANWDPREIPATYEALKRLQEQSGSAVPSFLATHPDPGNREATTRALAQQAIAGKNTATLRVATSEFKQKIAGMVYGDDPRQGFFENGVFYHPGLRFEFQVPGGWKVANSPTQVLAVSPDQKAGIQMSMVPSQGASSPQAYVQMLQQKGGITGANGSTQRVGGRPAWVGAVRTQSQGGTTQRLGRAVIQRESGSFYQFVGAPAGSVDNAFESTVGSFRELTDASKINRQPDRIQLVTVSGSGQTVASVASRESNLAVSVDQIAFLNGLQANSPVPSGFLLKVVKKGNVRS